ncbi:Uncharacterised protein [Mycobacteroides abscessus]|nr:Uncharacterised protein [Mycobacteroides abscessus]
MPVAQSEIDAGDVMVCQTRSAEYGKNCPTVTEVRSSGDVVIPLGYRSCARRAGDQADTSVTRQCGG